jgi:hypothetical protein
MLLAATPASMHTCEKCELARQSSWPLAQRATKRVAVESGKLRQIRNAERLIGGHLVPIDYRPL